MFKKCASITKKIKSEKHYPFSDVINNDRFFISIRAGTIRLMRMVGNGDPKIFPKISRNRWHYYSVPMGATGFKIYAEERKGGWKYGEPFFFFLDPFTKKGDIDKFFPREQHICSLF